MGKKNIGMILVILLLIAGIIGSAFWLYVIFGGVRTDAQVQAIQPHQRNTGVDFVYSVEQETYTGHCTYPRNAKIQSGDTLHIYYLRQKPEKAYLLRNGGIWFVTVIILAPAVVLYYRKKKH